MFSFTMAVWANGQAPLYFRILWRYKITFCFNFIMITHLMLTSWLLTIYVAMVEFSGPVQRDR